MTYDASYHRSERLRALDRWSKVGVLEPRLKLPVEEAFAARVSKRSTSFFKPLILEDLDSVIFHRELSYLVDAFDSLPWRVDIAFDSTWKAFELETKEIMMTDNATDRLKATALVVDSKIVAQLCANFPVQSCEYLFKRLVSDVVGGCADRGLVNRIQGLADQSVHVLLGHLRSSYIHGSADSRRNGALLLRRALRGETLKLGNISEFRLDEISQARVLISLFLYSARNERFHGASFSPFVSSKASIGTYTHPFFAFLSSYYLLLCVWMEKRPQVLRNDADGLLSSLDGNLKSALNLFGTHWEK